MGAPTLLMLIPDALIAVNSLLRLRLPIVNTEESSNDIWIAILTNHGIVKI